MCYRKTGRNSFILSSCVQQAGHKQYFVSLGVSAGRVRRSFLFCSHALKHGRILQDTAVVSSAVVYGGQELVLPFCIGKGEQQERLWTLEAFLRVESISLLESVFNFPDDGEYGASKTVICFHSRAV